ncbi:MAG: thiazole synthase [Candidatus Sumerlaeaceae bacterium]|nr:thiazole synthase [Candidatus Sumerlaeaceae bacterium]
MAQATKPATGDKKLKIGKHEFTSRLLVGTGKYATFELMQEALEVSGCEVVTVALRRVDLEAHGRGEKNLLDYLDTSKYTLLPNTAGCFNKEDAIRICRLARELEIGDMVKLEVLSEQKTLLPDPIETLEATKVLVAEGFTVLAYTSDDPIMAKKLEDVGAAAVMPLGSPIGSGLGILNPNNIAIILEQASVPIIVDAGVGTASDVCVAMELGVGGVLLNTGIAGAQDPVRMARAMKAACEAGRDAFLSGRIPKKRYATASSPLKDF